MKKKHAVKWLVLPVLALITFGLTRLAYKYPSVTENLYSQKIYVFIAGKLSPFSNLFPFSLDDLFYFLLLSGFLILPVLLIARKVSVVKALKTVLNLMALTYSLFYFLWGFNYFRQDIYERLDLSGHEPNPTLFIEQLKLTIEATNQSWCEFDNVGKTEIDWYIEDSYQKLSGALRLKYPAGKRRAKNITASSFFAKAGISGYYGPFFNEVHVNSKILPVEYPFVLAHEKAHQFGITNEAEASFYAWMVGVKSPSKHLQYSANLHILRYFLSQAYRLEEYPEIIKELDEKVIQDLKNIAENWQKLRNENIDKVASKANDIYLKSNKIEKGIQNYQGVLKFVMDYSYDTGFQNRHNLKPR
jgi:hypothetical protein